MRARCCVVAFVLCGCVQITGMREREVYDGGVDTADAKPDLTTICRDGGTYMTDCSGVSVDLCIDRDNCGVCASRCKDDFDLLECREGRCLDHAQVSWPIEERPTCDSLGGGLARKDATTKLTWLDEVSGVFHDLPSAEAFCKGKSGAVAIDVWRLPSRVELISLFRWSSTGGTNTCIATTPPMPVGYYCTRSRIPDSTKPYLVFYPELNIDPELGDLMTSAGCHARCVHEEGGLPIDDPRFEKVTGGIYDRVTDLTWEQPPPDVASTFAQAGEHCSKDLTSSGAPWSLPTVKQLESIVDERHRPAIFREWFTGTPDEGYWSKDFVSTKKWMVYFNWGYSFPVDPAGDILTSKPRVRCVHQGRP